MDKPAISITRALADIDRAAVVAFAKKGVNVADTGWHDEAGKVLVEERALGSEAEFINAGVRKESDVRVTVGGAVARFGRLDVAVNNASTEGQPGPITDQTAETYTLRRSKRNVLGFVLSMKHRVRVMQEQGSGSVVNICSTHGHVGAAGASACAGSKRAVESITKSVALEVAQSGIRVNGVAPGATDTSMLTRFAGTAENKAALATQVPLGRVGLSEELADAIVFIASDEASFITGHILTADGGMTAN
nr:SDR family oxidoreductase [Streptomyces sp. S1D4-11]QIZ01341.1 SDR family oxidoreductase [Streptomyces sp. S1D4-11]